MGKDHINYLKTTVPETDNNLRARKFVLKHYRHVVKSKDNLHRSFARKEISVNGTAIEETRILKAGDVIEVKYDTSIEEANKMKIIPIRICYEDDHLAVVHKPSGQNVVLFEKAIHFNTALKDPGGNRLKVWCINDIQKAASGLIIVAKTEAVKDLLVQEYKGDEVKVIMRVLCHGFVPTTDISTLFDPEQKKLDKDAESIVPNDIIKSINIISQTPSNNSGYISKLDLELATPLSNTILRKLFYFHSDHSIIGNSSFTLPLKANNDRGLCTSIISVTFTHPILGTVVNVKESEPDKFGVICSREAKFHQRKLDREAEEIKQAGVLPIDLEERTQGQLLAYVLGQKDFFGHRFKINKDCLIPRPASETLVQATINIIENRHSNNNNPVKILDVGTGCGNLIVSILEKIPDCFGVGIDISDSVLAVAKENAANILKEGQGRIEWRNQDMATINEIEAFDVLVCNPPYMDSEKAEKKREHMISFEQEPAEALFAKDQGYEWYIVLSKIAPITVKQNGRIVLECGKGMMPKVLEIWSASGWEQESKYRDVQNWERCLVLKRIDGYNVSYSKSLVNPKGDTFQQNKTRL